MFDLEKSIAEWRRQMLAAGIKTPVPLEELGIHLREEIERQIQTGVTEQQAFASATAQIGPAEPLNVEFKKSGGFPDWLGEDKNTRTNRVFAMLWLAYCSWIFFPMTFPIVSLLFNAIFYGQQFGINFGFLFALLIDVIFLRGMIASILLFCGKNKEIRTIRFIAVLGLMAFVPQIIAFRTVSPLAITYTAFNVASIWLLRSPKKPKLTTK